MAYANGLLYGDPTLGLEGAIKQGGWEGIKWGGGRRVADWVLAELSAYHQ